MSHDPHRALNARLDNEPPPPFIPAHRPTSAPCTGKPTDRPTSASRYRQPADRPTSARRAGHDNEIVRRGTDVDAAVAVAEDALTEEGSWHTERRQHRRKKNTKITGHYCLVVVISLAWNVFLICI